MADGARCRVCGCTDDDCSQCVARAGHACWWVEADLCSACAPAMSKDVGTVADVVGHDGPVTVEEVRASLDAELRSLGLRVLSVEPGERAPAAPPAEEPAMKVTLEPTSQIVTVDGVEARVWEGVDDTGVKVFALITRIAVSEDEPPEVHRRFAEQLRARRTPHVIWSAQLKL